MKKALLVVCLAGCCITVCAQLPSKCGIIAVRNNGNDHPGNCAGTTGAPTAANFANTSYADLPGETKTGEIIFKYSGANYQTLKPFAITKISEATGVTRDLPITVGPASMPVLSGTTDVFVKYCTYGINLPNAGTLIFELTDPETGNIFGNCLYDASCKTNCLYTNIPLPVLINNFKLNKVPKGIQLQWQVLQPSYAISFEIEYSSDGITFKNFYEQAGTNATAYSFISPIPDNPVGYYRLKIIGKDGGQLYSNMLRYINNSTSISVSNIQFDVLLNRVTADANLDHADVLYIQLTNMNGQVLLNKKINAAPGSNILSIEMPELSTGIYALKISCKEKVWIQKLVK